jgi:hypothetical protein
MAAWFNSLAFTRAKAPEKDKLRSLLRELLEAQRGPEERAVSKEQLELFEALWKAEHPEDEPPEEPEPASANGSEAASRRFESLATQAAGAQRGPGASGA